MVYRNERKTSRKIAKKWSSERRVRAEREVDDDKVKIDISVFGVLK